MGSHVGGDDIHRMALIQLPHDTQLLQFGLLVQSVSALSLHGGDPQPEHRIEAPPARCHQFLFCRIPGSPGGIEDAAAPPHDFHVAVAPHPPGELLLPVSAEDKVGMGIYKARQQRLSGGVDEVVIPFVDRDRFILFQNVGDEAFCHDHRSILHDLQIRHLFSPLPGGAAAGHHLCRIMYDQVVHKLFTLAFHSFQPRIASIRKTEY